MKTNKGKVFLVGAGPGYPGYMTIRGNECLQMADVIVYDNLVSREIMATVPASARLIYVGKKGGNHSMPQEMINRLLIREASLGRTVVRLKGGDPVLFGRGAEEAEELARAGIFFEFVPGVSSALAVPSCAAIPVTRRGLSSSVTIATGHEMPGKRSPSVKWGKLLDKHSTVVVLMGVASMKSTVRKLKHPDMPAAVISSGSLNSQKVVTGTLSNIVDRAAKSGIRPPAILVAGRVVSLRDKLWGHMLKPFLPLSGKSILVTRPYPASEELAELLKERGATVSVFPLIKIMPSPAKAVDEVMERILSCTWIILTSANGVDLFARALKRNGIAPHDLSHIKIAAIGPKTAAALEACGLKPDVVPDTFVQESLAAALCEFSGQERGTVIIFHSQDSRSALTQLLQQQGFTVEEVSLYRSAFTGTVQRLRALLKARQADMITVTSSSCVKSLDRLMDDGGIKPLRQQIELAAIGPVCAGTARSSGFRVSAEATQYTSEGLVEAIEKYYGGGKRI
ncbi:MAG: uroporphyrinogen-III C-methyltransferase [Endomicrobiales bacterium]